MKCLVRCGALDAMPKSINGRTYCEIEGKMRSFSEGLGIPMDHMDFVMWYKEKGEIFK